MIKHKNPIITNIRTKRKLFKANHKHLIIPTLKRIKLWKSLQQIIKNHTPNKNKNENGNDNKPIRNTKQLTQTYQTAN